MSKIKKYVIEYYPIAKIFRVYIKSWVGSRKYLENGDSLSLDDEPSLFNTFGNKTDAENKIMSFHELKYRQGITFFDVNSQ